MIDRDGNAEETFVLSRVQVSIHDDKWKGDKGLFTFALGGRTGSAR